MEDSEFVDDPGKTHKHLAKWTQSIKEIKI